MLAENLIMIRPKKTARTAQKNLQRIVQPIIQQKRTRSSKDTHVCNPWNLVFSKMALYPTTTRPYLGGKSSAKFIELMPFDSRKAKHIPIYTIYNTPRLSGSTLTHGENT